MWWINAFCLRSRSQTCIYFNQRTKYRPSTKAFELKQIFIKWWLPYFIQPFYTFNARQLSFSREKRSMCMCGLSWSFCFSSLSLIRTLFVAFLLRSFSLCHIVCYHLGFFLSLSHDFSLRSKTFLLLAFHSISLLLFSPLLSCWLSELVGLRCVYFILFWFELWARQKKQFSFHTESALQ